MHKNSADQKTGCRIIRRTGVALLMIPVLLTACSLPGRKAAPPIQTYLLQTVPAEQHQAASPAATPCFDLGLSRPDAGPGFDTPRMAYVDQPHRLNYFAYHQWADTPARMLGAALQRRLETSGLFRAVIMLPTSVPLTLDLRLDTELIGLQQVFTAETSHVLLEIRATLMALTQRRLLAGRVFVIQEPAIERNPDAGVAAANQATEKFMQDLLSFLRMEIVQLPSDCGERTAVSPE